MPVYGSSPASAGSWAAHSAAETLQPVALAPVRVLPVLVTARAGDRLRAPAAVEAQLGDAAVRVGVGVDHRAERTGRDPVDARVVEQVRDRAVAVDGRHRAGERLADEHLAVTPDLELQRPGKPVDDRCGHDRRSMCRCAARRRHDEQPGDTDRRAQLSQFVAPHVTSLSWSRWMMVQSSSAVPSRAMGLPGHLRGATTRAGGVGPRARGTVRST